MPTFPPALQAPAPSLPAADRRARVLARLGEDLLVVPARSGRKEDDQPGFAQASDFTYLTGLTRGPGGVLVLDGREGTSTLFLPPPGGLFDRWIPARDEGTRARLQVTALLHLGDLEGWLKARQDPGRRLRVALPGSAGTAPGPLAGPRAAWQVWAQGTFTFAPADEVLAPLREVKDPGELEALRAAGRASTALVRTAFREIRPGRRQRAVEAQVVARAFEVGEGPSFWPWIMGGPNGVFPTVFASFGDPHHLDRTLRAGELVRVDVGARAQGYAGDVGRTVPVSGRFDPGQRETWDTFIAAYRAGLPHLKAGVPTAQVYAAVLEEVRRRQPRLKTDLARKAAAFLLGPGGTQWFELHGVGLDSAEGMPEVLRADMVLAYELMFAVDGQGFYLEDMVHITPTGYELLTPGLPTTAQEIEAAMRR